MQSRLRRVVLLCVLALAVLVPRDAGAVALTPGSYTVSMKYVRNNTVHVRLAMYSFRSDHSFRADYWEWDSGPLWDRTKDVAPIGIAYDEQGWIHPTDYSESVYGSKHFVGATGNGNENLTTRFGTWSLYKGTNIKIIWNDTGDIEWWKRTWHDNTLNKIELFYIGYADDIRGTHVRLDQTNRSFSRVNALNAGYGFGGDTVGFTFGYQTVAQFANLRTRGQRIVWNRYCIDFPDKCVNPPRYIDSIGSNITDFNEMRVTNLGVLRKFTPGSENYLTGKDVYSYVAIPAGNTGMTSRRAVFHLGNDFNNTGTIANGGHFTSALQIIDSSRNIRGFLMTETTFEQPSNPPDPADRNAMFIMSAMFLLDDESAAAQTGIEDPNNW